VPVAGGLPGADGLGDGPGDVADGDGVGLVGGRLVGVAVGVGRLVLGAGAGSSWVQATGPARNAATNRAVMTGRRTMLLGLGVPPPASGWRGRRDVGARMSGQPRV